MKTHFSMISLIGLALALIFSFGSIACKNDPPSRINTGINDGGSEKSIKDIIRDIKREKPKNKQTNPPKNNERPTETSANETYLPTNERTASDMPFDQLVTVSRNLLDEFWAREFAARGISYQTARGFYYYIQPLNTPCGVLELNNAFYCERNHSVYFDDRFLRKVYNEAGDFAVVTILAHEWGHLAQRNLGIVRDNRTIYSIQTELQADCFAGAFAGYVDQKGMLEDYDLDEGGAKLFNVGDLKGTPWFDRQAHGRPIERIDAYLEGYKRGIRQCFTYTQNQ